MWQRVWGLGLVAALIAIASVVACRQLVGITDNPPEDLTSTFCGLPYGTNECASCVQANCCAESMACAVDPTCAAHEDCLGKCNGDPGCRSQCFVDSPPRTSSDVSILSACLASNCETACGLTCGSMGAHIAPPNASAACEKCLESNGECGPAQACGSSVDCQEYAQCLHAYTTPDWLQACATDHDAGAALFAPVENAASTDPCSTACAYGQDWRCLGHVTWPPPVATTTKIIWESVTDSVHSTPIRNARILYCLTSADSAGQIVDDSSCDPPRGSGQTDDAGYVAIDVPTTNHVVNVNEAYEPYFLVSAPGYVSVYGYYVFPLSQSTFTDRMSLLNIDNPGLTGVVPGGDVGNIVAISSDCQWHLASGVQVARQDLAYGNVVTTGGSGIPSGLAQLSGVPLGNLSLTATAPGTADGGPGATIGQFSVTVYGSADIYLIFGPQP